MNSFTGTGQLIRLILRRDRVTLPVWILSITGLVAITVQSAAGLYKTPTDFHTYATVNAANVVTRIANGPIGGATLGSVVIAESYALLASLVPIMAVLLIIRHTRQNEETGRAELVGAAHVGRLASLTAALIVVISASLLVGGLVALTFMGVDLPVGGSLLLGAATAAAGVVFAAVAAVAAQVASTGRAANGLAIGALLLAFVVRAGGDVMGKTNPDGVSVTSGGATWASPLGWISLVHAYSEDNWWVLSLFAAVFVVFTIAAYVLATQRDVGFGLLPDRKGRASASPLLGSTLGLAWRLQRNTLVAWLVVFVLMGLAMGSIGDQLDELAGDNLAMIDIIKQMGGVGALRDVFFGAMLVFMALAAAGYGLQACLTMRGEETSGTLESLLGTAAGRTRWLFSHVIVAAGGAALLMVVCGFTMGLTFGLATNDYGQVLRLTWASLVYVLPVLVLIGFAVAAFGLLPRIAAGLAWGGLTVCLLFGQIGGLLKLPEAVLNISPYSHVPSVPAESVTVAPLVGLAAVAVALVAVGVVAFRRRDIVMS